jgi:hypothetical protein
MTLLFVVPLALIAGFLAWRQYRILKTWPAVDAQVVHSDWARHGSQSGRGPVGSYSVEFRFRYRVGGRLYESRATAGYNSANFAEVQRWLKELPVGSHREIRYEPDNPQVISLANDYGALSFAASYALARWVLVLGAVAGALILLGWYVDRRRAAWQRETPSAVP